MLAEKKTCLINLNLIFKPSLKGHQATPLVHVCVSTCVHQALLFSLSPNIALKSAWQSPPNLTTRLRTQMHRVLLLTQTLEKGRDVRQKLRGEKQCELTSYQPSENPHVQPLQRH